MNTTFMEAISITISSMTIVMIILSLIAIILSSFKYIFKEEKQELKLVKKEVIEDVDADEEKIVAAIVTSIIAAEDGNHSNFHVKSIRRIK